MTAEFPRLPYKITLVFLHRNVVVDDCVCTLLYLLRTCRWCWSIHHRRSVWLHVGGPLLLHSLLLSSSSSSIGCYCFFLLFRVELKVQPLGEPLLSSLVHRRRSFRLLARRGGRNPAVEAVPMKRTGTKGQFSVLTLEKRRGKLTLCPPRSGAGIPSRRLWLRDRARSRTQAVPRSRKHSGS